MNKGTIDFSTLTTNDNVKYGLVYSEDIYKYLMNLARFSIEECDECRKACVLGLPEIEAWKTAFVARCDCGELDNAIDKERMFDVLAMAFKHSKNRSHAVAYFMSACAKRNLRPKHILEHFTEVLNGIKE